MDESIVKHLEKSAISKPKLSALIREGIYLVENEVSFCGCAIGAAWRAKYGSKFSYAHHPVGSILDWDAFMAEKLVFPVDLVRAISRGHFSGSMTREQCADYAESKGY